MKTSLLTFCTVDEQRWKCNRTNYLHYRGSIGYYLTFYHNFISSLSLYDIIFFLQVFLHVTSIGLNEQELSFISYVMGGPHSTLWGSDHHPEIHQVNTNQLFLNKQNFKTVLTVVTFLCDLFLLTVIAWSEILVINKKDFSMFNPLYVEIAKSTC